MNENINLCEVLKGYKGKTFYSRCFGNIILVDSINLKFKTSKEHKEIIIKYYCNGRYSKDGEQDLFPSKHQCDWNKWVEEQNNKTPKTWSELVKKDNRTITYNLEAVHNDYQPHSTCYSPIEKSALAFLKIRQLIEAGYGGNVTNEEWNGINTYVSIQYYTDKHNFDTCLNIYIKSNIAFHTKRQAKEFLKYPENIQLLKDYFMI